MKWRKEACTLGAWRDRQTRQMKEVLMSAWLEKTGVIGISLAMLEVNASTGSSGCILRL